MGEWKQYQTRFRQYHPWHYCFFWVIFTHSYHIILYSSSQNSKENLHSAKRFSWMLIENYLKPNNISSHIQILFSVTGDKSKDLMFVFTFQNLFAQNAIFFWILFNSNRSMRVWTMRYSVSYSYFFPPTKWINFILTDSITCRKYNLKPLPNLHHWISH